jgi:hypothetical protein
VTGSAWDTLGLKRTDDVAAIRKAYARRLKATDVDADPAAFIALRGALERALADARWGAVEEGEEDEPAFEPAFDAAFEEAAFGGGNWRDGQAIEMGLTFEPPATAGDPGASPYRRLDALLFGQGKDFPDPDALIAAVRDILADPELANVDRAAQAEQWLAGTLYDSIPCSDPVIALVVGHFGWEQGAGRWDQPFLFEEIVARHRAILLLDHVAEPGHVMHKAYLDLISPEEKLGLDRFFIGGSVRRLLTLIRERCPSAEDDLNAHRVALWDDRHGHSISSGLRGAAALFWLAFVAFKLMAWWANS